MLRALNPKGGKKLLKLQELDLSMQFGCGDEWFRKEGYQRVGEMVGP